MEAMDLTGLGAAIHTGTGHAATIQTASIGIPDTLFLMLLALVVFGPRRLPEIGRQIGKLMYEFRKVSNDFKFQMEEELRASEEADRLRRIESATPVAPVALPVADATPLGLGSGEGASSPEATSASDLDTIPAVAGEVRAELPRFPQIAPPATGAPVSALKPFRGRAADFARAASENGAGVEIAAISNTEPALESGAAPDAVPDAAVAGSSAAEEEVRHV